MGAQLKMIFFKWLFGFKGAIKSREFTDVVFGELCKSSTFPQYPSHYISNTSDLF